MSPKQTYVVLWCQINGLLPSPSLKFTAMPRTPSLDALRIFAVAARYRSFTEAALTLNLTQSAISHRIRGLEEELGFALFKRLSRRLELTPQGEALARKLDAAIGEIDRSIAKLSDPDQNAPLKITSLPSVALRWLIPRLPRIRSRYPDLEIQVVADPRPLDLRAEGIDLAIRFGRQPDPSYAVTHLMGDCMLPVCAPQLLEKWEPVDGIDGLVEMPLLHDSTTISNWRAWLDHFGRTDLACNAGQHFSEAGMTIEAAEHGLGVALARASLVADQMVSDTLVCPVHLAVPTSFSYYLLGLPEAAEAPRVSAIRSLLVAEAKATERVVRSIVTAPSAPASPVLALASE